MGHASWIEMQGIVCCWVDLSNANVAQLTSQDRFAALVKMGKILRRPPQQRLSLPQLPHQQDCVNHGAQTTRKVGTTNANGTNVLDVPHALQDGSGEGTPCF